MNMMSRNISSRLIFPYPGFSLGSWAGAKHSRTLKNFPVNIITVVITAFYS